MADILFTVFWVMMPCSLVDSCRRFGGLDVSVLVVDEASMLISRFLFQLPVNFRLHCQVGAK
jgi:hypothetical protein